METQRTIREWAESTFGHAHPRNIVRRIQEEFIELTTTIDAYDGTMETGEIFSEIADVEICLRYLAERVGCDIQEAVDVKMAINRQREWVLDGNGNGYHKK